MGCLYLSLATPEVVVHVHLNYSGMHVLLWVLYTVVHLLFRSRLFCYFNADSLKSELGCSVNCFNADSLKWHDYIKSTMQHTTGSV